jgi:hypothetical protein
VELRDPFGSYCQPLAKRKKRFTGSASSGYFSTPLESFVELIRQYLGVIFPLMKGKETVKRY